MRLLQARPVCHLCKRPVDQLWEDEVWEHSVRYVAVCHGQRESVTLDAKDCQGLVFGEAFREPARLGAGADG